MQMEVRHGLLKSPGDSFSQAASVGDALQLVIRQLDREVLFEAGEELEDLQAVDAERLEKIGVRSERRAVDAEVPRREVEDLAGQFLYIAHARKL